jgi:hypothetical protein
MPPWEPHVAGPPSACAPDPARHRPVDPGAARLRRLKRLGRCPWPGRLAGLRRRLGPDGARPPGVTRLRADALGDGVAASAICARARHRDDRIPAMIPGGRPTDPRLARRTTRLVRVPSDLDMLDVQAGALAGLPVRVQAWGAQPGHAVVVPTVHEPGGVQDAGVHQMRAREKAPWRQRGVDRGGRRAVGCRAGCGGEVRDPGRQILLTGVRAVPCRAQTASKFPLRWWIINSTVVVYVGSTRLQGRIAAG